MSWEYNQYIAHHGIKGQKWGVRRYQNEDGTLTPEGKVRAKALASEIFNEASKTEPKITHDVTNTVTSVGAKLYGLQNRLKTRDSIERKIRVDAEQKGISVDEAAKSLKDSVRYTSVSDDRDYVSNYNSIKDSLAKKGYSEIRCRNYFELYAKGESKHKQITSVYQDQKGHRFELQYQTPSSIKAKEAKTPLYEESRKAGVSEKRRSELVREMERLADSIKDPKGVRSIKSHG